MLFKRTQNIGACELLLHYHQLIGGHVEYLSERNGIVEEVIAQSAVTELEFALKGTNSLKVYPAMISARDAIGDACFLLLEALKGAQQREAVMETFESVTDVALQQEETSRVRVRVTGEDQLQKIVDYHLKAHAILTHSCMKYGLDISSPDGTPAFIM